MVARLLWEQDVGSSSLPSRTTAPEIERFQGLFSLCLLFAYHGTGGKHILLCYNYSLDYKAISVENQYPIVYNCYIQDTETCWRAKNEQRRKAIKDIEEEKKKLDSQIELLRSQATELTYEAAMKKVGLLEHIFIILSREVNTDRLHELEIKTVQLKKEIKILKSSFNQSKVKNFNVRLTELYLSTGLSIKHLQEDLQDNSFSLEFDPFRLCLFATHKDQEQLVRFMPGSMTRQTHLQMLTYLCMFEYLKDNFPDFIYLPILIIDSANQPMGIEIFKEVYPTITQLADSIGIQTIFMSKDRLDSVSADDFIDISTGLNKFHKKS